jgi:hypothetical protein
MVVENPTWGAPRIHGELLMLGFDLCERTISRWMKRAPRRVRFVSFVNENYYLAEGVRPAASFLLA